MRAFFSPLGKTTQFLIFFDVASVLQHSLVLVQAFRNPRGHHSVKPSTHGASRTQASGGTSNRVYNASGHSANQYPFGIPIPGDSQQGNLNFTDAGNTASPSGVVDVTLNLEQKGL